MTHDILREGGPHNIRRTGQDQFTMEVKIPGDGSGMIGRACPAEECSPSTFGVRVGTGLGEQPEAFCPYCRTAAAPNAFATEEQLRYAKDVLKNELMDNVGRMMTEALGLGPTGKKTIGTGLLPISISLTRDHPQPVQHPQEEQVRRDITCPHCTLEHVVYGLAAWCPDCGRDIFLTHVETECEVLRTMLADVRRRNDELGSRVADRDLGNILEDIVSVLEATLKAMTRRRLLADGGTRVDVDALIVKRVRNRFQSYTGTVEVLQQLFAFDLPKRLDHDTADGFRRTMEKRHPITHNLGVVDRKYLDRVQTRELVGRDIELSEPEVGEALATATQVARVVHAGLFFEDATQ